MNNKKEKDVKIFVDIYHSLTLNPSGKWSFNIYVYFVLIKQMYIQISFVLYAFYFLTDELEKKIVTIDDDRWEIEQY